MQLDDVHRGIQKNKKRRRIGRGPGSGFGKTAGRGHKGHSSRSGFARKQNFIGGGTPLFRRIPKRGFHNPFALNIFALNVGDLNSVFEDGSTVTPEILAAKGLVKGVFDELKILGDGELTKKLKVSAHRFSKSAEGKITAAGGACDRLPPKRTPDERVEALKSAQS